MSEHPITITMPKLALPVQPPAFSVLVDEFGYAWQRLGNTWHGAGLTLKPAWSWAQLLATHPTLTVIRWGKAA